MSDWRVDLLKIIGAKPTKANMKFLSTWQRWEGGHTNNDARYNWLNTTKDAPGAVAEINSVGVKRFDSYRHGIQATAATLANGHYDDIVKGLLAGDPYAHDLSRGLQTWVAGPNGSNPGYVAKVMGQPLAPTKPPRAARSAARPTKLSRQPQFGAQSEPGLDMDLMSIVWEDDPEFLATLQQLNYRPVSPAYAPPLAPAKVKAAKGKAAEGAGFTTQRKGSLLILPTKWESTHPTSGLEDQGFTSAIDIMGKAGTIVGAPEAGIVVYFHPTGAQGGGSMLLRTPSGREYWIGHIANGVKAGTRVKRGQRIADISADHDAPHVHLDRKG